MDKDRFRYLRDCRELNGTRIHVIDDIRDWNKATITTIGEDKIKEMIWKYFDENKITTADIDKISYMIRRATGEELDMSASIVQIFYEILTKKILLPVVSESELNEEKMYEQIVEIVDRTKNKFIKKIERDQGNDFFSITIPDLERIREEFMMIGNFFPRDFSLGGIFGQAYITNDVNRVMDFEVPIRVDDEMTSGDFPAIKKSEAYKILHNYQKKHSQKLSDEDIDMYWHFDNNDKLQYGSDENSKYVLLKISTQPIFDDMSDAEMRENFEKNFSVVKEIVCLLAEASGVKHNDRHFVFSNSLADVKNENYGFMLVGDEDDDRGRGFAWDRDDDSSEPMVLDKFAVDMSGKISLDAVGGNLESKKEVEKLIKTIKFSEKMKEWGVKPSSGVIFEWPPGTGKTLFAKVIASEVDAKVYNIKLTDIAASAYINESSGNMRKLFDELRNQAKKGEKIIVIFDEMDALLSHRKSSRGSKEDTKVVNTFLSELSGFDDLENVIFVGTTNHLESLDPAVIRSGRMSTKITVGLPDVVGLEQIYNIHISKIAKNSEKFAKLIEGYDFSNIAKKSVGLSGADVEEVVRQVAELKALEDLDGAENISLSDADFEQFISRIKNTGQTRSIGFMAQH